MKLVKGLLYASLSVLLIVVVVYFIVVNRQETTPLTDSIRAQAPGRFIDLSQGRVHYQLDGSDSSEMILFIHGGGCSGMEVYDGIVPYWKTQGYRTLAYDLYDRGYSDRLNKPNTPELFLTQLTELMDSLHVRGKLNVVSSSLGSMVALDFAAQHPERIQKFIMIDPSATGALKINLLLQIPLVSDLIMALHWYPNAIENQRKTFVDQESFESYSIRQAYFMNIPGYKATNYSTWTDLQIHDKSVLLRALPDSSVLILYGEQDPYFPKESSLKHYGSLYPTLAALGIPDAGHLPHIEKPEAVVLAIDKFIKRK